MLHELQKIKLGLQLEQQSDRMQRHWHWWQHNRRTRLPENDALQLPLPRVGGHANPMVCPRWSNLHCNSIEKKKQKQSIIRQPNKA